MNPGAKLAAFALVLAAMFGGGIGLGSAVGPIDIGEDGEHGADHTPGSTEDPTSPLPAGGLLVSQGGYTFEVDDRELPLASAGELRFVITDPEGRPLTRYDELHERKLHLVVVARNLTTYAHVHPTIDSTGTWSADLPALPSGGYRAFADFAPAGGERLTLGIDLLVPGEVTSQGSLAEQRTAQVDGYEVTLEGDAGPGEESELTITVRRDGEIITTEPYLGAAGHLVAIRDGDLAYLHVHPVGTTPDGPVRFMVDAPSIGAYGLYFDFAHDGAVHTAAFTLIATPDQEHHS